jgi:hypothetical protein
MLERIEGPKPLHQIPELTCRHQNDAKGNENFIKKITGTLNDYFYAQKLRSESRIHDSGPVGRKEKTNFYLC